MTIRSFTFNPFATNCFVCHDGQEAVIVDPSCHTPEEQEEVLDYVGGHELDVREILLTHAHIDHILGCRALADALQVGVRVHRDELQLLRAAAQQGVMFGIQIEDPPEPTAWLEPGTDIRVGSAAWQVFHTPGHSPGSVSFFDPEAGFVISGDVLFAGSIGRTDLWGGSLPVLMESIFQVLVPLGDATRVLPGHGPETTIGRERAVNPYLQA